MKNTEMEIVKFENKDVIATSVGFTLSGFANGVNGDATITVGADVWTYNNNPTTFTDNINNSLRALGFQGPFINGTAFRFYTEKNQSGHYTLFNAFENDYNGSSAQSNIWNGYYRYSTDEQRFIKVSAN